MLKLDPLWQFIKDGIDELSSEFTAQDHMATIMNANKGKMVVSQENLDANREANQKINQEEMEAKMDTIINGVQEKMEATISSIWSELEETIRNWLEDGLASVDHLIQGLSEELVVKVEEMQLGLQAVMTSFDTRTKNLYKEIRMDIQEAGINIKKRWP